MKRKINITVATSIDGTGGIATVLTGYKISGFFKSTNTELITSHKIGRLGKVSLLICFFLALIKFIFLFIFYKVNIVHLHMSSRGSYSRKALFTKLAKLFGSKVIIHLHGSEFQIFYSDESSLKKQAHIRDTFNMADKVIVLSTQWEQWMNTIVTDTSKVCVVYNAVPEVKLPNKTEVKKVILFLGRLSKRKGVDDLIHAFFRISKTHPNVVLNLAGDGDLNFYKKLIEDLSLTQHVKLLGWVTGNDKNQCLANATIYCLPSYNEGFPMGVLEAMSSKVAVISSMAGGIPDAITDKKEGLLIDAGNISALADVLSTLLDDPKQREEYTNAALAKYRKYFCPEVINAQLISIYSQLS
ncbi:MAG: glycosyltransferase family 4 protein [Saccharospirillaceae bacterium]|nr:glycosyltransferase family 4 protein [Saccharospirillaceae bacterium]